MESDFTSKKQYITEWIKFVSDKRPELGGYPVCPYAAAAKYEIVECDASKIEPITGKDVVIYIIENHFNLDEVQKWVDFYNEKYKLWDFFEDCATYNTFIGGVQTNNGKYNLILGQPKEKLKKFREQLAKTTYYSYWDKEYLQEILQDDYDRLISG